MEQVNYSEHIGDLIFQARQGTPRALEQLLEILYHEEPFWLIIELMRKGVREDDALDAAYTVIVKFIEKFPDFRGTTLQQIRHVLKAYYVPNVASRDYRRQYRQIPLYPQEFLELLDILPKYPTGASVPHNVQYSLKEALEQIKNTLTQQQYTVWLFQIYNGESYQDIAKEFELSLRQVERLLEEARERVQSLRSINALSVNGCFKPSPPKTGDDFTLCLRVWNWDVREVKDLSLVADIRGRKGPIVAMNILGEGKSQPWRFSWKRLYGDDGIQVTLCKGNRSRHITLPFPEV